MYKYFANQFQMGRLAKTDFFSCFTGPYDYNGITYIYLLYWYMWSPTVDHALN